MDDVQLLAAVLFFICSIAAGAVIQWGVSKIRVYKPPVSILWFLFGILICLLELVVIPKHKFITNGHEENEIAVSPHSALGLISIGIAEASRMPHNALYYIVLPILLYDATQLVNWHHFKKNIKTGLMLAVSGIVLQVFVLGVLMQWSFSNNGAAPTTAMIKSTSAEVLNFFHPSTAPPLSLMEEANYFSPPAYVSGDSKLELSGFDKLMNNTDVKAAQAGDADGHDSGEPSFSSSCMIAAAVGATDPIAVLGVLEALDAPAQLVSLFDCESLINDGTAIFMFTFFKSMSRGGSVSWNHAVQEFFRLLLGGPVVGLLIAAVLYRCIKHFRFHPFDVTLLVIAVAYLVFFVAEIYLKTSAPLAIVVYGLYFKAYAKAAFDADTAQVHNTFVRGLATAMTSLVFIISGIACMRITWDTLTGALNLEIPDEYPKFEEQSASYLRLLGEPSGQSPSSSAVRDLWHVPVFYLFCNLARGLMILLFSPLIKKDLGTFNWKEGLLLWWGGLRGGVCLILALLIEQDEDIPEQLASKAALYCASAVFLILVINGTTFEFLFRWLKPYKANPFKEMYLLKVLKFIDEEYEHEANLLQSHWLYQGTNILKFSDQLVPVLGDSVMHEMKGLQIPHIGIRKTLDELKVSDLILPYLVSTSTETSRQTSPLKMASYLESQASGPSRLLSLGSKAQTAPAAEPIDIEMGIFESQETGHEAAAKIQNLNVPLLHDVDVVKTVEKLQMCEPVLSDERQSGFTPDPEPEFTGSRHAYSSMNENTLDRSILPNNETETDDHVPISVGEPPTPESKNWDDEEEAWLNVDAAGRIEPPPTSVPLPVINTIREDGDILHHGHSLPNTDPPIRHSEIIVSTSSANELDGRKVVRWQASIGQKQDKDKPTHLAPANDFDQEPARRQPLYKSGGYVYRIRSEPYNGHLDTANIGRITADIDQGRVRGPGAEPLLGDSTGIMNKEVDWASHFLTRRESESIPRTMSVPNHVGGRDRVRFSRSQGPKPVPTKDDPKGAQERVRPWHREGEVVTMVVNSMRHLYKRMYEQSFISGTCLVSFMAANDSVSDYAISEDRTESFKWLWSLFENRNVLDQVIDGKKLSQVNKFDNGWRERCPTCDYSIRQERHALAKSKMEHITPFDLEWILVCTRLRLMNRWKVSSIRELGRRCFCKPAPAVETLDGGTSIDDGDEVADEAMSELPNKKSKFAFTRQRFLVWLWALIGPRQIFPALDDLQTLCAYVDVHEEMLVRGDRGLKFILGQKLLKSYSIRTARGKSAVRHLKDFYPESFPYALLCHGAIFLINLKIQLVEEYHERGLLMTSDCEVILEVLKHQIVRVTKYHPRYLFS